MGAIARRKAANASFVTNLDKQVILNEFNKLDPNAYYWDGLDNPTVLWQGSKLIQAAHLGICGTSSLQIGWSQYGLVDGVWTRIGNNNNAVCPSSFYTFDKTRDAYPFNGDDPLTWGEFHGENTVASVKNVTAANVAALQVGTIRIHGASVKWAELECVGYPADNSGRDFINTKTDPTVPDVLPLTVSNGVASGGNPRIVQILDTTINEAHDAGCGVIYCLGDTPGWASTTTARNNWGIVGASSMCSNIADWKNYVTWIVTRYNGTSTKKIKALELWNEPQFNYNSTTHTYDALGTSAPAAEWIDTLLNLAILQQAAYQAAKAVDPSIKVLTPGFTGIDQYLDSLGPTLIAAYLNTQLPDGTYCRQYVDGLAVHLYGASVDPTTVNLHDTCRKQLQWGGMAYTTPLYNTECGMLHPADNTGAYNAGYWFFQQATNRMRGRYIVRLTLLHAVLGAESSSWWHFVSPECGSPGRYPSNAAEWPTFRQKLVGRTVTKLEVFSTNWRAQHHMRVTFQEGDTLII
jgi:hypothetical protein